MPAKPKQRKLQLKAPCLELYKLNPPARVWVWDKLLEDGKLAQPEKSPPSSSISVFFGTSEYKVSQRASIVIRSTQRASLASCLTVCIDDLETGLTYSLPGTVVQVDISGGWPVITVSE